MGIDTEDIDFGDIDYADPCAVLAVMKPRYYQMVAGASAQTVTFEAGNGSQKTVMFHKSDLPRFGTLIAKLEQECAEKSGKRTRFAIRAGGRI